MNSIDLLYIHFDYYNLTIQTEFRKKVKQKTQNLGKKNNTAFIWL